MADAMSHFLSWSREAIFGIRLTRQDMAFLKQHTKCDDKSIKDLFKDFKKNSPKGQMTKQQFLNMYKKFFPEKKDSGEFCNHVFRTFDTDNNGFICFREFLLAINILSTGTPQEKLRMAFNMYDLDGDGVIAKFELTIIVQSIFNMLGTNAGSKNEVDSASKRAKNIFAQLDENGDHKITKAEFISGCLKDEDLAKLLTTNACWLVIPEEFF